MEAFDAKLMDPIPLSQREFIVESLWSYRKSALQDKEKLGDFLDLYFKYYVEQCNIIGDQESDKHSSLETHSDILDIAQLLQQPLNREEVRNGVSDLLSTADDEQHENSINLVARLLLMIKFGDPPHECRGGRSVHWSAGSLTEFMHSYFPRPPTRGNERIKLEKQFNALNLQRIAGIQILWTDNLADHLCMMDDDKKVAIFCHALFLECQLDSPIFPEGFIHETLQTIALLFPRHDPATRKWFQKAFSKSACRLDKQLIRIGNLKSAESRQMENFGYWHDRLVILKEVYDEARPSTLSQWWHDRRNGVQWYTFWVALLVLILTTMFGLIQCVEGALQVYAAFKK